MPKKFSIARKSRLIGAVAASAIALTMLAACSSGGGAGSSPSATGQGDPGVTGSTLADIQKRGVINIGVGLTTPPFAIPDSNGNPSGFDIDLANQFADFLGVKANLFEVTGDGRIPALQSGKADAVIFTLTDTPARREQIDFSSPYINAWQAVGVKADSSIQSISEIADKTIAIQKGTQASAIVPSAFPNANIQQYDTEVNTFTALAQGQADALVDSSAALGYHLKTDNSIRILPGLVPGDAIQGYAIGMQKGDTTLVDEANAFMKEFHAKGEGKILYEKWFGNAAPDTFFKGLED